MPETRPVTIETPLGADALTFVAMRGREALGELFEYTIDLVSDDTNVALNSLLGQPVAVRLELAAGAGRYFHGHVTSVEFLDHARPEAGYRIVVRPWLWLLQNNANCRIFQNKSVPDIVKQVFRDQGLTDFEEALSEDYPKLEYVVQYRESDFNFVSRLLEHVGIYYYFRHTKSAHTLVLADSYSAHSASPQCKGLPYLPPDAHRTALTEGVDRWLVTQRMIPGAVALRDFDFERPNANLTSKAAAPKDHHAADGEVYDYPGGYKIRADGDAQARIRLERQQEPYERTVGHTNARALATGALFTLSEHPRDDQNRECLITWTTVAITGHASFSGSVAHAPTFSCDFGAIDSGVPFRTQKLRRKPVVEGPQTAEVVGKAGEDIWTDKYGRVKVQFHWDRLGERNENSSCWVRVAQVWAGSNWGAMHVPRIGQEVIVDFLEGDPDRPIITGRVYNGSNMPPYDLPGSQTKSGIKSRSTKGGGVSNANEIRFEDRKGSEEFFVQAEKDMNSVIKDSETRSVGANRSTRVGANESLTVMKNRSADVSVNETISIGANETMTVGGNETRMIKGDESISVGANNAVAVGASQQWFVGTTDATTIGADQTLTVGGARTHTVGGPETIIVGGPQSIAAPAQSLTVGARTKTVATDESAQIGGSFTLAVAGARSESVGGDDTVTISGGQTVTIGKAGAISVSNGLVIDAGDEIVLKAGDASITLKKNGDIILKGKNLTTDASGKVSVTAASDLVLKGSKISQN